MLFRGTPPRRLFEVIGVAILFKLQPNITAFLVPYGGMIGMTGNDVDAFVTIGVVAAALWCIYLIVTDRKYPNRRF